MKQILKKLIMKKQFRLIVSMFIYAQLVIALTACEKDNELQEVNEPQLQKIVSNLLFAEGPAYFNEELYFSDIQANKIYKWNENDGSQTFMNNSGGANGICIDKSGNLIVCQGGNKQIVSIDESQDITVLTDTYNNTPYNEPNDVWVAPNGNIYFTDPLFTGTLSQPGEYVYCLLASSGEVIKVIDDVVRPNGIIGTSDGSTLYVADYGASQIYQYTISSNGTLNNKQVFAGVQADGLSIDTEGNIYAASEDVMIYNSSGELLKTIEIPGTLTNICIVEDEDTIAFITTHNAVYKQVIY